MSPRVRGSVLIFFATLLVACFSSWPAYQFNSDDESALLVSIRRITEKESHCTQEEKKAFLDAMKKNRAHMNRPGRECGSRDRVNLLLTQQVDDGAPVNRLIKPSGFHNDGAAYFHEHFPLKPGKHRVVISLRDNTAKQGFSYTFDQEITFAPRQVITLDFESPKKSFLMR